MGAHAAPMAGIGGEKFSGKSSDWPDTKTEIIAWFAASGYSYIPQMGTSLFHLAGSGDHDHVEDGDLEKHFKKQMWPTQLLSIRSEVTKKTQSRGVVPHEQLQGRQGATRPPFA